MSRNFRWAVFALNLAVGCAGIALLNPVNVVIGIANIVVAIVLLSQLLESA